MVAVDSHLCSAVAVGVEILISTGMVVVDKRFVVSLGAGGIVGTRRFDGVKTGLDIRLTGV